jgi:hypothetical protein
MRNIVRFRDFTPSLKRVSYIVRKSCPITGLNRPTGFQEVKAPRFLEIGIGCQPYAPAAFTPRINLVLIFRG